MRNRRGFTLVELLVVIGIIALLIAILLPVIGKARMAGYSVKCLANLKQLHNIGALYVSENRGWCIPRSHSGWYGPGGPSPWSPSAVPGNPPSDYNVPTPWPSKFSWNWDTDYEFWHAAGLPDPVGSTLDPTSLDWWDPNTLKVPRGMACPLAIIAINARDTHDCVPLHNSYGLNVDDGSTYSKTSTPGGQYAMSPPPGGNAARHWLQTTWTLSSIRRPADKIEYADGCDTWVRAGGSMYYPDNGEKTFQPTPPVGNMIAYRHGKWKVNIAFWDGHCETKDKDEILVKDGTGFNQPDLNDQQSAANYYKYWVYNAP